MDNESEMIRQEMEETRTALQDKLETLEQQVKETVQSATVAVTDTVATVKEAVHDTVDSVKGAVHETVDSVKDAFDLPQQVEKHPWPMFLGAAAVGFLGGRLLYRMMPPPAPVYVPPSYSPLASVGHAPAISPAVPPEPPKKGLLEEVAETYHDELTKLKGLAIATVGGLVREMLVQSAPPPMAEQIRDVVDSVTTKLGGHPFAGPIVDLSSDAETQKAVGGNGHGIGNGKHRKATVPPESGEWRGESEDEGNRLPRF